MRTRATPPPTRAPAGCLAGPVGRDPVAHDDPVECAPVGRDPVGDAPVGDAPVAHDDAAVGHGTALGYRS